MAESAARTDISWLVGGPQGSGIESAANIFSHACARMGYHVYGKREFYSNIKGEHSYFVVRVSDREVRSNVTGVDMIVAYDAETLFRHAGDLREGGVLIYDAGLEKTELADVGTVDSACRARLAERLDAAGLPHTVESAVRMARDAGMRAYAVSFRSILSSLADATGNPKLGGMTRMFNVISTALSMKALGVGLERVSESVAMVFEKKPEIARINTMAAERAYASADAGFEGGARLAPRPGGPDGRMLVQGFHGTALGKIASGCRFQSYYPITPASEESVYLESNAILGIRHSRPGSTLVLQCEDEISAIGMAIGSALTGTRSSTCTSGPGFSLMVECLGWAGINEVPLVVTLYQRSGPATGMPTRHGQDDLLFAIHAGHGEFPRIVYASGDVEESFYDTARCFNYAEDYQVPVIHLMDKALASSVSTCSRFDASALRISRGKLLSSAPADGYKRFELGGDGISPRSWIGLENGVFWCTGDEHDERGHIEEDPVVRASMMEKRLGRMEAMLRRIPDAELASSYGEGGTVIVSWGSTKGAILDAMRELARRGVGGVRFVQVKMLHPFPAGYVAHLLEGARVIIDVESNYAGQLGALLRQNLMRDPDHYILKYTGRAMTETEIADAVERIAAGRGGKREVLAYGA